MLPLVLIEDLKISWYIAVVCDKYVGVLEDIPAENQDILVKFMSSLDPPQSSSSLNVMIAVAFLYIIFSVLLNFQLLQLDTVIL